MTESCVVSKLNWAVSATILIGLVAVAGCATKAKDVSAAYVSPTMFQSFSCEQLKVEAERVSARVQELTGVQNKKARDDAVATGLAIVVFWPAVFLVKGDNSSTAELGRLKGQMDAVEQASIQKKCNLQFQRPGD